MNSENRKGLAHLEYLIIPSYQLQALHYFITMDDLDVEVTDKRTIDPDRLEVVISMPRETDPKAFVARWKEWQEEELYFDYAILN